jgi:hypothetical protein
MAKPIAESRTEHIAQPPGVPSVSTPEPNVKPTPTPNIAARIAHTEPGKLPGAFVPRACFQFAEAYCRTNPGSKMVIIEYPNQLGTILVLTPDKGLVDSFHPYPVFLNLPEFTPREQLKAFFALYGYEWSEETTFDVIDYDHLDEDSYAILTAMRAHQLPHTEAVVHNK